MPCLHKYLLKELLKLFIIIQSIILVMFVFIEYLSMLNRFLKSDITLLGALWFVILEIPSMFVQVAPASVLLANIFVFGLMNRNNELLALKSSGVSTYSLIKPAMLLGLAFVLVMFFLGEILVPISMIEAHNIETTVIRRQKNISLSKNNVWIKSDKKLIHFNYYDHVKESVAGVTIIEMGSGFKPEFRFDAKSGFCKDGIWVFEHVIQQTYNQSKDDYDVAIFKTKSIALDIKPNDIGQIAKKSNEMGFFELGKYVAKIQKEGYDATTYVVDLNSKIAFPFICFIMALTGAATGMRSFAKESIPKAIIVGIIISFIYWFLHGFCMSLGYGSSLPPLLAAWMANFFFFCFGSIYLITTK